MTFNLYRNGKKTDYICFDPVSQRFVDIKCDLGIRTSYGATDYTNYETRDMIHDKIEVDDIPFGYIIIDTSTLRDITISNMKKLYAISIRNTIIRSLKLSDLSALTNLVLFNNGLEHLDISGISSLRVLKVWFNELKNINVPSELEELWVSHNRLETLDLSLVPRLKVLEVSYNSLTYLDLSRTRVIKLIAFGLNLEWLYVSDPPEDMDIRESNIKRISENISMYFELDKGQPFQISHTLHVSDVLSSLPFPILEEVLPHITSNFD